MARDRRGRARSLVAHALCYFAVKRVAPGRWPRFTGRLRPLVGLGRGEALAKRVAHWVAGRGTCLSRAMAVASCVEGATVVVGVRPGADGEGRGRFDGAHAWVELDGRVVEPTEADGEALWRWRPSG